MTAMDELVNSSVEVLNDAKIKQERVRAYLPKKGYKGVLVSTREHFAWLTGGGDSHVVRNSSMGFGTLVITADNAYLIAHSMDAARLAEEQVKDQGYEIITLHWHDGDVRNHALKLIDGKSASDTELPGAINVYDDLVDLHYPMTSLEIERLRWLAKTTDRLFTDFAKTVAPGMTENEIAANLHCRHLTAGMEVDVLIVGSDDRCFKYRHPIPTQKQLEKYLMLHTVARRWGLHCNLTRFVHFGIPDMRVQQVYLAAANVEACVFQTIKPGIKFSQILSWQKEWYAAQGYPDEWHNHFQGGPTGYVIVDAGRCLTDKVVQVNQPYEWFITVTGTKTGELAILTEAGLEIASYAHSDWPGLEITTEFGKITVPGIMIR